MKRLLSLLLVMLLMFSLVACGGKKEDSNATNDEGTTATTDEGMKSDVIKDVEGTISVQVEKDWKAYYEAAVARVKANNPKATINLIETGSFDHIDVITSTDITNEDVADVFAYPADRLTGFIQNDVLAAIDANAMAARVGGYNDFDGGLGGLFKIEGEYFGFPMNIETLVNFVNTKNAGTLGIDLGSPIEMSTADLQSVLIPVWNAWFGVAVTNSAEIELLGKNDAGELFSDLTKDFSELTQEQKDLFTFLFNYWKAHNEAGTALWDKDAAWGYMDTEFTSGGKTAVRLEGPWSTGSLSKFAGEGADLGLMPISNVTVNGKGLNHWKGGWALGVNARVEGDDAKMQLAQAMIEEIINPEFAVDFFNASGKILPNVDTQVYADSTLSETNKAVIDAVVKSYADAPARPLFKEWDQVWGTWENSILSWSAVKPANVEAAYAEVQAAFKAMMANF